MSLGDELPKIVNRAKFRQHLSEISDVITTIAQRGRVKRRQPQGIYAQPLEVVQFANQAGDIAHPVTIGVIKGAHHHFVKHGPSVPLGVMLQPAMNGRGREVHGQSFMGFELGEALV